MGLKLLAIETYETLGNVQNVGCVIKWAHKGQFNDYGIDEKAYYFNRSLIGRYTILALAE